MTAYLTILRWFLQRITGLLLVVFLAVHVITLHFTIHEAINFQIVVTRVQSSVFWLIFYGLFLLLTLWHGLNGFYEVVEDYAPSRFLRRLLVWICWLGGFVLLIWGLKVLSNWWR